MGVDGRGSKGRRLITPQILEEMRGYYAGGKSLAEAGLLSGGFCAAAVLKAFRKAGIRTRDHKEAGVIGGPKHGGDTHWTRVNPPSCKPETYKSVRIKDSDGTVRKRRRHVVLMEQSIGRRLFSYECVHHKDGNRHNNKLSNLQLMTRSEHTRIENLKSRSEHPERHQLKRDAGTGRYVPDPTKPWSVNNPKSPLGKACMNKQKREKK